MFLQYIQRTPTSLNRLASALEGQCPIFKQVRQSQWWRGLRQLFPQLFTSLDTVRGDNRRTCSRYHGPMCAHYESIKDPKRLQRHFDVAPPADQGKTDVWPGYLSTFIRRPKEGATGDDTLPNREAMLGSFGMVPHWAKDETVARRTYNARTETVAEKPSFRDAWRLGRRCIIPADAFYEPDWRTGKAVATRIARADGEPMGIAGIWTGWKSPTGEILRSFSMLTINADAHPLMRLFHKPDDEKRMVVILPKERYQDWLEVPQEECQDFFALYPAAALTAEAVARP